MFIDADLTYPVENIARIEAELLAGADVAIASRVHPESRYVMAPAFFATSTPATTQDACSMHLVRATVVRGLTDTQAGLKGFHRHVVHKLVPRITMERFSFDVELLHLAQRLGLRIEEVPVTFIYCKEPSTLQLARDGVTMALDLLRIRARSAAGAYDGDAGLTPIEGGAKTSRSTTSAFNPASHDSAERRCQGRRDVRRRRLESAWPALPRRRPAHQAAHPGRSSARVHQPFGLLHAEA